MLSILLISCFSIGFAQNQKISLNVSGVTLKTFMGMIEQQTNLSFMYTDTEVNEQQKVSVKCKEESVKNVLEKVLAGKNMTFKIVGNQIILKKVTVGEPIEIRGKVRDKNGEPIVAANIFVFSSSTGAVTDYEGNFTVSARLNEKIRVSYIGYESQELPVRQDMEVILKSNSETLEEVVVIGYGTQKKVNLTGAVESVNVSGAKTRAYTNAELMLQGNVTGAFVSQTSGQPGNDGATIRIRGIGTFNNANPLIIIDGMEGSLNDVNPKDIQTMSVLKDAASCAIYGNRAANGVVLIETKSGALNKMTIEYSGLYGVQEATSLPKVLEGIEYLDQKALAYKNTNGSYPGWYTEEYMNNYRNRVDEYMYPTNYSWMDDVYKAAPMTDHYIAISGGGKSLRYSTSVGYLYQKGIVEGNSSKKFTFRSNVSAGFLNDRIKVNANVSTYQRIVDDLVDGMSTAIYSAYVAPPTIRMKIPGLGYSNYGYNFAAHADGALNKTKTMPLSINGSVNINPLKGLDITASGGFNKSNEEHKIFKPTVYLFQLADDGTLITPTPNKSSIYLSESESQTITFNVVGHYNRVFAEKHNLSVDAGFEMREYTAKSHWMSRENMTVNLPEFGVGDPNTQKNGSNASEIAWVSYFGRLKYNYNGRYLFEFSLRDDGSSRFIDKWGIFPSTSVAWRLSEEGFMKPLKPVLNNLKFRFSWGRLGNESIGQSYAASDELSLDQKINLNNTLVGAAAITKLANRNTTWETTEQYNYGLDFDLFNSRFSGTLEYYIKNTSDILMQVPVSSTLGMTTTPYQNAGKMQNRGLEMTFRYNGDIGPVNAAITLSAAHMSNKIKSLAGRDEIIMGTTVWRVGRAFNSFYGLKTKGIYQSDEEIRNHLIFQRDGSPVNPYIGMIPVPGDIRFKDKINVDTDGDGIADVRDGVIDDKDKDIIGRSFPSWTFSASVNLNWKNFDLTMFFQGVSGISSLNQGIITVPFFGGESNTGAWYRNAWTPENPSKKIQRVYSDPSRAEIISDYYLEDASYLRLKSLDLGYTLPRSLMAKLGNPDYQIRVFFTAQNLFTWTNMRYGFDPEKPSSTTNTLQYPQTRIFSAGINVKF